MSNCGVKSESSHEICLHPSWHFVVTWFVFLPFLHLAISKIWSWLLSLCIKLQGRCALKSADFCVCWVNPGDLCWASSLCGFLRAFSFDKCPCQKVLSPRGWGWYFSMIKSANTWIRSSDSNSSSATQELCAFRQVISPLMLCFFFNKVEIGLVSISWLLWG